MAKHKTRDCQVPGGITGQKTWKCPECGRRWDWKPDAGAGSTLWHGKENVRNADGSKPRKNGLWEWLTT